MIKLTINPNIAPVIWTFNQKNISIGSGSGPTKADLSLSDSSLQSIHLKIVDEGHRFIIINFANDPFATLNGLPFGKKTLKTQDLIHIGSHTILFEVEENSYPKMHLETANQTNALNTIVAKLIDSDRETIGDHSTTPSFLSSNQEPSPDFELFSTIDPIKDPLNNQDETKTEPKDDVSFEDLIREVELQFEERQEIYSPSKERQKENLQPEIKNISQPKSSETHNCPLNSSLNHDLPTNSFAYKKAQPAFEVGEFDDECEHWKTDKEETNHSPLIEESTGFINWKLVGTIFVTLLFVTILIAGALYFNTSAKNEDEELRAAEGVADIAMALKYAQIHHIKPHKKNWSDPEFIKLSLAHVIPHDYPSLTRIDPQGHLNKTSYSLRIYTSTDFSQFLVIAQPAPSVLQWLIPKTAVVIDSKLMQLRKVADMKTLNRLLVNSNNLDNSNAVEVTNLVKRGELIPLSTLAQKRKGHDFSPPKALTLLRPGAENYVYNAPRYYQFGETIIKKAIGLSEYPGSAYELSRLKQEMSLLSKMSDMVLYSSDGIQLTLEAQKAIATFISNSRFLTAYLKFNSEGTIIGSHLVIDDEGARLSNAESAISTNSNTQPLNQEIIAQADTKVSSELVQDPGQHPLLTKLNNLRASREKKLSPLKNQIANYLEKDTQVPSEAFEKNINDLISEYNHLDLKLKQEATQSIHELAEEYRLMPLDEFIDFLNQAGLSHLQSATHHSKSSIQLQQYIQQIKESNHFIVLEKTLTEAFAWLVVKNFTNLHELQFSQRLIRKETLDRLNTLIISASPLPCELGCDHLQRKALENILKLCCLDSPEEDQYYLDEFDKLQK